MKKLWKRSLTAVCACVMGMTVGGCTVEPEGAADPDSVIVVMDTNSEPDAGFDPSYGWGAGEHVHEPLIQSTLTVTTSDLTIGYDLATDISVSDDGLLWTVRIRDDIFFTDGERLTAGDVAFTYNLVKENSNVSDFTMLDRAETADETTVLFYMNRPYSIWPYSMSNVGIVPEHAYSPEYGSNPIGSGRYILKQWDRGQQVILEANPDYYGDAPGITYVTILFMEEDAAYAAVQAGQADLAYTAVSYAGQEPLGYTLHSYDTVDNRGINLPATPADGERGNDFTADVTVRQAINIGIDRELMIEHVLEGYGSPAYSVCDKMPWFSEAAVVDYQPEEAARLLNEAGWLTGSDGIRAKDGDTASLNILYPAGDSVRQALAAETANQLRELGIETSVEGVGWDTAYDRAQSEPLVWGWGAHTPMELYNIYHTSDTGYAAYSPYTNEMVDSLMDEALEIMDLEESYGLWQSAQEVIAEEVPWIWLVNIDHLYWVRDGLEIAEQKVHPHGHGWSIVNHIDQWYWDN